MLAGGQKGLVFVLLLGTAATLADDVCVCTNTCLHKRDGQCNDGGPGSSDGTCELGSDCADCGPSIRDGAGEKGALCPAQLLDLEHKQDGAWKEAGGKWESGCAVGRGRTSAAAKCAACTPGRSATEAQARCVRCARGRYSDAPAAAACAPCAAGRWQDWSQEGRDAASCQLCAAGRVVEAAGQVSDTCVLCPLGKYSGPQADRCVASCPPGSRLKSNIWGQKVGCANCEAGRFQAEGGNAHCTPCPLGSYSIEGQQGCTSCAARCGAEAYPQDCGAGGKAGACVSCEQGRRADWLAHPRCQHCPAGRVQDPHQYHLCNAVPTPAPSLAPTTPEPQRATWLTRQRDHKLRRGGGGGGGGRHRDESDTTPSSWFAAFHHAKGQRAAPPHRPVKQTKKKYESYEDMVKALAHHLRAAKKKT